MLFRRLSVLASPPFTLVLPTIAIGVFLTVASPVFLTTPNLTNIALYASWTGAAAAVATIVICSGGLDLSITSIIVLVAEVGTVLLGDGVPAPVAIAIMFAAGAGCGLVNGMIIVFARVNPFIVTLGTNLAFYGVALVISSGNVLTLDNESVRQIGQAKVGQIPVAALVALGVYAAAGFAMRFMRFGTHIFAIGGNEVAASRSGIAVRRTKLIIYVLSGLSGALSAWILIAITGAALPTGVGAQDLLTIVAAVILGGTALTGGKGTVLGTLIGTTLLALIGNGLVLLNITPFYQPITTGVILVAAVLIGERGFRKPVEAGL